MSFDPVSYAMGKTAGGGTDVSDTTATAADVLDRKVFHLSDGTKATGTIQSQAAQTITPTTADQTIPAGKYLAGAQTIKGDANLVASNIKKDVQIFGVYGSYEGSGGSIQPQKVVRVTHNGTIYITPDSGYDGIAEIVVQVDVPMQQDITGDFLNTGTVNISDFAAFYMMYGMTGYNIPADFNNDGSVDYADLTQFLGQYNKTDEEGT